MRLVPLPWAPGIRALPFLTILAPSERFAARQGRRHKQLTAWARQGMRQLLRWVPHRASVCVADSSFGTHELAWRIGQRATLISRLRLDANLFAPPPPRAPNKRGRPRQKGPPLPKLQTRLDDAAARWPSLTLPRWYGSSKEKTLQIISDTALWYRPGTPPQAIRWGRVRDPEGARAPQACFCTDTHMAPAKILAPFVRRGQGEVTFQELRAHLGRETQRPWSHAAIARPPPRPLRALQPRLPLGHRPALDKPPVLRRRLVPANPRHLLRCHRGHPMPTLAWKQFIALPATPGTKHNSARQDQADAVRPLLRSLMHKVELRDRLRMCSMGDSSEQVASQGHRDPGGGAGEAVFIASPQASPPGQPPTGARDTPSAGPTLEARGGGETAHARKDEGAEGGLSQEGGLGVSPGGAQRLAPRPPLAPGVEEPLRAGAGGASGGGEGDHPQAPGGIDCRLPFAPACPRGPGPAAGRTGCGGVDRSMPPADGLAVRPGTPPRTGGKEPQPPPPHPAPAPPLPRRPRRTGLRTPPPAAPRARPGTAGVPPRAKGHARLAAPRHRRPPRRSPHPFLSTQRARRTPRLPLQHGPPAARLSGPQEKPGSPPAYLRNPMLKRSLRALPARP